MPIRAARLKVKELSNHYYSYGKLVASRTYLLLILSLSFISYFSLPVISNYFKGVISPTSRSNIPLSHISTSLDSQCWHASAHVEFNNFSLSRHPPSNYLLTEQIRLSHPNKPISFELIQQAKNIYDSLTTTIIQGTDAPVSLSTICYKHKGQCLIHAPPFQQFRNRVEWEAKTSINSHTNYENHPYSVYSNATFDQQGRFIKADAILLTFVLNQTQHGNTIHIWNKILQQVKLKYNILDIDHYPLDTQASIWSASSNILPHMIQYKFNLFSFDVPAQVQFSIVAYLIIFYFISMLFGKSNLVKSGYTFGLAAVFLSIACFTTTWGIFDKLGISFHSVPWYLLLLVVNIASFENIFLLTNAVLDAGCDMIVKEKISRGLQSIGLPMTATLIAELLILSVGQYMDSDLIKEFCVFTKLALLVEYALELTFVIAVLSFDIKRVELADLDDRQMSKRLHELNGADHEKERQKSDFCPVQDTENKDDSKSCAECKEFKTHRVFNSFMLCLMLLSLSLFCTKEHHSHTALEKDVFVYQPHLNQLSDQFWSTVNPRKDVTWLQIQPPHLFIYDSDAEGVRDHLNFLQHLYQVKSMDVRYKVQHRPSLFRLFISSIFQKICIFILKINVPVLILCLVMIAIITWMTPKWRNQWLVPLLIHCFNQFFLAAYRFFPIHYLYRIAKGQPLESHGKEYDADGVHRGAITVQNIFNQQQYRANVKTVHVQTLSHQHLADIQSLDANAKQSLVSCGHDGRVVLWNAHRDHPDWLARLDQLQSGRGGLPQATLNKPKKENKKQVLSLSKQLFSKPRMVKLDGGNKWIATAYDDGLIRIWNVTTGVLMRELDVQPQMEIQQEQPVLRHRFEQPDLKRRRQVDRILALQFMGVIPEFCHPIIAEVAARCGSDNLEASQNYLVSAHKSGLLHEWDIISGECIQTIQTGHTKDITQLLVVDSRAPHRKLGVSWVFTASKDGLVQCWERKALKKLEELPDFVNRWSRAYTIKQNHPVTSIATEFPVGGMGVLVTGCSDGTVKVWNFETGEIVSTLSVGKAIPSSNPGSVSTDSVGPMRRFAKLSHHVAYSSDEEDDSDRSTGRKDGKRSVASLANHRAGIFQVAVTRYCEVENGPGLCRGCDTCFGNGFLVASNAMDNKVHAWRLERSDSGHEGSCTLCTKDYHRKQYKHRKTSAEDDKPARRNRRPSSQAVKTRRPVKTTDYDLELLDIEQLAGDAHIPLKPNFLGKIDQPGGRGIVFCDKILAGVRRAKKGTEWEAWFASLQYYDPFIDDEQHQSTGIWKIPIETFGLETDQSAVSSDKPEDGGANQLLKSTLLGLFSSTPVKDPLLKYKGGIHGVSDERRRPVADLDEDSLEADENLPFSTIRHVISLDGAGLACDYGNFIKLVYLDKPSHTEKEKLKLANTDLESRPKIVEQMLVEEDTDSGCQCEHSEEEKDGCCGGKNKEKNGGQCCGGKGRLDKIKSKQQEIRQQKLLAKQKTTKSSSNGCGGISSITECSIRNNCSKASECASTSQAIASSVSVSSFSNWL